MKISVLGGGSSYTPELVKGIVEISADVEIDELWLYDIEEGREKLETVHSLAERLVGGRFEVISTLDPIEAIRDSDFVIFQFRPGGLRARERDETVPLKYGLVGQETTGVGGFAAALRAFPEVEMYLDLVEAHSRATVINFTNPSGHITEFVLNYLGFGRFIGLCNIPINLVEFVSEMFSVEPGDVFLGYYGLNHLTFLERVYVRGEDVTEDFFKAIYKDPPKDGEFPTWLIESLGLLPNPYLRYYLMTDEVLDELKSSVPRARQVMEIERELFELYRTASDVPPQLSKRGGRLYSRAAAYLMRGLKLGGGIHIVNTRNDGAVRNLPDDYVLEIPTLVRGGKVFPVSVGDADEFALAFIHPLKMYERLTIEAYLKRSRKIALKALLSHPLGPKVSKVRELLDEIFKVNDFDF